MTDNVIRFPSDRTPDDLLAEHAGKLSSVIVMGITRDGSLEYDAAGHNNFAQILGHIETAKHLWIMESLGYAD